ncbi:ATP-binding protein, partial [Bradyrhizobium ottawaense]|uniref:ATP-binding protein n=1 Tax=Bradyrhizobium ottawaense TaxID=931866 RepID=UPI0030C6DDC2
ERRDLLEILEDRHGRASTIVTSQLPVDTWHGAIGDPTVADAILDRLVHNAHRLQLTGESMRKRSAKTITLDGNQNTDYIPHRPSRAGHDRVNSVLTIARNRGSRAVKSAL